MTSNYDKYNQLHERGPIIAQSGYQGATLYVIGYQEAKQILGDHKRFVKDIQNTLPPEQRTQRQAGTDMFSLLYNNMLETDAPDHTRLRALVSKAFTNRHIQSLAPRIQEITDELIDGFEAEGEVDLIEKFAFPLPIIVICELLGIPSEDRDKFRIWSHAFLGIEGNEHTYVQLMTDFLRYIEQMINDRRLNPRDDLISGLVHAEEDGQQLSEQELFSMIALLIVAGHETTVNLIGNGMAALLQHPEQIALLQWNPDLIESAIEEFLRYEGPVEFSTTRYAAEDVQIGDMFIKRGTAVIVILAAANRDPAAFMEPTILDITRESNKHLGFGYGVHYCLGAPLARLETRIAFNTLLKRLPTIRLGVSASTLQYNESSIVRGLVRLPICWDV